MKHLIIAILLGGSCSLIAQLNTKNLEFDRYTKGELGLEGRDFFGSTVDDNGYYWIGANYGSGLFRYDGYEFRHFSTNNLDSSIITDNSIRYIARDREGFIWISTRWGLDRLDPISLHFTHFLHDPQDSTSLSNDFVEPLYEDHDGMLWVGAANGLNRYDREEGRFDFFPCDLPMSRANFILKIFDDPSDHSKLVIGSSNGVRYFDKKSEQFEEIRIGVAMDRYPKDSYYSIFGCYKTDAGDLLLNIGGINYLAVQDGKTKEWVAHDLGTKVNFNIYGNVASYDTKPYNDSLFWISSSSGLYIYNINDQTFEAIPMDWDKPTALLPSVIRRIGSDHYGRLILPSLEGISIGKDKDCIKRFLLKNRYVGINYIVNAGRKRNVKSKTTVKDDHPPIYEVIRDIYNKDSLLINFSLPNPMDKSKIIYQYSINGNDNNWIDNGHINHITLYQFNGGIHQYRFRAKETSDSEWIYSSILTIEVPYFFFQTLWFKLLAGLLLLGIVTYLYRLRIDYIKKEEALRADFIKKLAEVEMEALRAQMNPHFLFNTMNSINHFILKNEADAASTYLTKFSRLVRQTLNNSKEKLVTLEDEINTLNLYLELEQLRFDNKFDFEIIVENNLPITRRIPPMIIQPYIENAIWHGLMHKEGKGNIYISFTKETNHITISIKDDGIGREKAKSYKTDYKTKQKSYGMQITQNRLDLVKRIYNMNADIEINDLYTNGIASGTEVVLSVPLI